MVTKELIDYIRSEMSRGVPKDRIRDMLLKSEWDSKDIDEAEEVIADSPAVATKPAMTTVVTPVMPTTPVIEPISEPILKPISEPISVPEIKKLEVVSGTIHPVTSAKLLATLNAFQTKPAEKPRRSKSFLRKLLIPMIIFLTLISGGAVYGFYTGYLVPLSIIGGGVFQSVQEAKSATFDTTVTIDASAVKQETSSLNMLPGYSPNMSLTASGVYDISSSSNPTFSATVSLKAGTFSMSADTKLVSNIFYIKATDFPLVPFFDITTSKDTWLSLSTEGGEEQKNIFPLTTSPITNPLSLEGLTDEQKAHIATMLESAHVINVTKREKPEEIDGVPAYHVSFDLNLSNITQFFLDLELYVRSISNNNPALSAFSTASFSESLNNIKSFAGEVWIGRKDYLPYKVVINMASQEGKDSNSIVKMNITSLFKNWNAPVTIEAPKDSIPLMSFIENTVQRAQNKSLDALLLTKLSSARADAEVYFSTHNSSYADLCTIFNVPTEKPLPSQDEGSALRCASSATAFVVYAPLAENPGSFFCIDSKGVTKELSKEPKGLVCK
ncbi:MAG: hypothetical protein RL641_876 [Candidatus Parcubacteria bacterium]|jgi:hypothetical protein